MCWAVLMKEAENHISYENVSNIRVHAQSRYRDHTSGIETIEDDISPINLL